MKNILDQKVSNPNFVKKGLLAAAALAAAQWLILYGPVLAAPHAHPHATGAASKAGQAKPPEQPDSKKAPKEYDAWTVKQKIDLYGDQLLTVSPIGMKTSNYRSTISVVLMPPYDTVLVYNQTSKLYFLGPVKAFRAPMGRSLALFNNLSLSEAPIEKVGTGIFGGLPVVKCRTTQAFKDSQLKLRKAERIPASNPISVNSQSADLFNLPAGASAGICKYYNMPLVPGAPLEMIYKDTDGDEHKYLLSGPPSKTKVTAADFVMPAGYKRLKNIEEINQGNVTEEAVQLFGPSDRRP